MDDTRRQALLARRAALKKQLRRAGEVAYLRDLPQQLAAAGTPYLLHHQGDPDTPDWRRELVPFGHPYLDWGAATPSLEVALFDHWYDRFPAVVLDAVIARAAPEDAILLVSSNGFRPMVEVTRSAFEQHVEVLLDIDPDMWIAGRNKPWLIEIHDPYVRAIG